MTISKKLFLVATLGLNLGSQLLCADYQEMRQNMFNLATTLSKTNNKDAQTVANWLIEINANDYCAHIEAITAILNASLTIEEKIEYLLQLKTTIETKDAARKAENDQNDQAWKKEKQISEFVGCIAVVASVAVLPALVVFSLNAGAQATQAVFGELLIK